MRTLRLEAAPKCTLCLQGDTTYLLLNGDRKFNLCDGCLEALCYMGFVRYVEGTYFLPEEFTDYVPLVDNPVAKEG